MRERVRVKICGITNEDDALLAIDAGADALGFNLYSGSKRYVNLKEIQPWLERLRDKVIRVGLLVNPTLEEIQRVHPLFDVLQLHGQENAALCAAAAGSGKIWKAFPITADLNPAHVAQFDADALVVDSAVPGAFGGTGVLADLDKAARFLAEFNEKPVWLSGGLDPENVSMAIEKVHPYGVDVASGVELRGNPRKKDQARIVAFMAITNS